MRATFRESRRQTPKSGAQVDLVLQCAGSFVLQLSGAHIWRCVTWLGLIGLVVLTATPVGLLRLIRRFHRPDRPVRPTHRRRRRDDRPADPEWRLSRFTPRIASGSSGGGIHTIDNVLTFGLSALPGFVISEFWLPRAVSRRWAVAALISPRHSAARRFSSRSTKLTAIRLRRSCRTSLSRTFRSGRTAR